MVELRVKQCADIEEHAVEIVETTKRRILQSRRRIEMTRNLVARRQRSLPIHARIRATAVESPDGPGQDAVR